MLGVLIFSISTIKTYNQKNSTYTEITSTVIDYDYNDDGLKAIIVEYIVDGHTYRKTSDSYSSTLKSKGTQVKVKYNPDDHSDAIWVNDTINIILPIVGVMFAIVGIVIIVSVIKGD